MLAKPDMAAITNLKLVAYGNAKENSDGSYSCQHGAGECEADAQELCLQYKLADDSTTDMWSQSMAAWPFILCMEEADGNPAKGESCYGSSMGNSTISWSTISECVENEFDVVTGAAKDATPSHDYVPWSLVDGSLLENTNLLQKAVCDAYTGDKPASCKLSLDIDVEAPTAERSYVTSACTDCCDKRACEDQGLFCKCASTVVGTTCGCI